MPAQPTQRRKEFERHLDMYGWVLFAFALAGLVKRFVREPPADIGPHVEPVWDVLPVLIAFVVMWLVKYGFRALSAFRGVRLARWAGQFGLWLGSGLGLCWFSHALLVTLLAQVLPVPYLPFVVAGAVAAGIAQLRARTTVPIGGICLALWRLYIGWTVGAWTSWTWFVGLALSLIAGFGGSLVVGRWVVKTSGTVDPSG